MADQKENEAAQGSDGDAVMKKGASGAAAAGPNQKLVMIALLLNTVVMVATGVIVTINSIRSSHKVSLADVATAPTEEAPAAEGHGEKKEGKEAADNFVKESFTVNLADENGAHFAKVDVEIEADDAFVRDEIGKLRPKIRDFVNVMLSSKTYDQVVSQDGKDFLREGIRNKINGMLTRGQIKNIYFTQFIVQ